MGVANRIPNIIKGYHPKEVASQVKQDILFVYLRLVNYYLEEQRFQLLNEVDVIKIPIDEVKEQFDEKLKEFKITIFPHVIKVDSNTLYKSAPIQYKEGNLQFTFEYHHELNSRSIRFDIAYLFGYQEGISVIEGTVPLEW